MSKPAAAVDGGGAETNPNPIPKKKTRKVYRKGANGKIFNTIDSIKAAEAANAPPEPLPFDEVQISPRRWSRRRLGAALMGKDPLNSSGSKASTDRIVEPEQVEDEPEDDEDVDSDAEVGMEDDDSFASSRYSVLSELTASVAPSIMSAKAADLERVPSSIGPRSSKANVSPLVSSNKGENREAAALTAAAAAGAAAAASNPHPYTSRSLDNDEEDALDDAAGGIMKVSKSPRTPTKAPMPQVMEEDGVPAGTEANDSSPDAGDPPKRTPTGYTAGSQASNVISLASSRFSQEQIHTLQQEVQQSRKAKRRMCYLLALVVLLLVIGAVVITVFYFTRSDSPDPTPAPSRATTALPTATPVMIVPTEQPSIAPTEDGATAAPTRNLPPVSAFFLDVSPETSFDDPDSPQSQALLWMETDAYNQRLYYDNYDDSPYRIVQRFTLGILYYAQGGPNVEEEDGPWLAGEGPWLTGTDECSDWKGVKCGSDELADAMTSLSLFDEELDGTIPNEIGLVTELRALEMGRNGLTSTIPSSLGDLTQLTSVRLLENQLSGPLPPQLGTLTALTRWFVSDNPLLDGELPEGMGQWTELTVLNVRDTQVEGPLPDLSRLTNLQSLFTYNTNLSGSVPASLCETLQQARIDCGELVCECCTSQGGTTCETTAPTESPTQQDPNIEVLQTVIQQRSPSTDFESDDSPASLALDWMGQDAYSLEQIGDIDRNLERVVGRFSLVTLYFSTGGAPAWDSSLGWLDATDECQDWIGVECDGRGRIESLVLDAVNLTNLIPIEVGLLKELQHCSFRDNGLNAPFPIDSLLQLTYLDLSSNTLTGSVIPVEVGFMSELQTLLLSDCGLIGNVPPTFDDLKKLERLDLSRNAMGGEAPDFSSLTKLTQLALHDNDFTGTLEAPCSSLIEDAFVDCEIVTCSCCQSGADGTPCTPPTEA